MKKIKLVLIVMLVNLLLNSTFINVNATSLEDLSNGKYYEIDMTSFDQSKLKAPEHTCVYETEFNEYEHWKICYICKNIKEKSIHILGNNGGDKAACENVFSNTAYRETCFCGYESLPQMVIHGRYENYVNCHTLNYQYISGKKLEDIKQITYAEFKSISYPVLTGQEYTWTDPDGDGYGWVFCGGPIMGDENGVRGSVELIIGSEGDCGRKNTFDEYYSLTNYIRSVPAPTRTGFVAYLNNQINKSTVPSRHALQGYQTKYNQRVTDAQFSKIVSIFKGYSIHMSNWGWTSMNITHTGHTANGNSLYADVTCYDSSNNHNVSFIDGIKTTCDVCSASYTGNESFVNDTWYICNTSAYMQDGTVATCNGHSVFGLKNTYLGTAYCTFKRTGNTITRISVTCQPVSGGTYINNSTPNVNLPKADSTQINTYTYYGTVTFFLGNISRTIYCGALYPRIDMTPPISYQHINNITNNSYWNVTGNGTIDKTSTQATVKVTFYDNKDYSRNTLSVRVYDYDKQTIIPQGNGNILVPLQNISGNNSLWQTNINIPAEIKGAKNIYIQAIDATGNISELIPMEVTYLDAKGPVMDINVNNTEWSDEKILTINAYDGFDIAYVGLSADDMLEVTTDKYNGKRNYILKGDLYENKQLTIYATDSSGNLSFKTITINKLDNTAPTITNTNVIYEDKEAIITITANDINESINTSGSGVAGYAITNTNQAPNSYQPSNILTVTKNGIYYIWVKDIVGNITSKQIEVSGIVCNVVTQSGIGGTISNNMIIKYNESTSIFIVPMKGYEVKDVIVDGVSVGKVKTYNFLNISKDHTIIALFYKTDEWESELNKMDQKYKQINIK